MVRLFQAGPGCRIEFYAKKASTAFAFGDMVYIDSSGFVAPATATSSPGILGLIYKKIAATDSDYASTTRVPVLVPDSRTIFEGDVGTGSATQTVVGEFKDLTDKSSIDLTADTFGVVFITGFTSASVVQFRMSQKSGAAAG